MKQALATAQAPAAIGPYSQGIAAGQTVYVSGQLPIDPATGAIPEGIAAQTAQSLKNIQAILAEQGMTLADVVKTTVFLADMNDFAEMNKVYGEYFAQPFPARSAVQVAKLPKGAPSAQGRTAGDRMHRREVTEHPIRERDGATLWNRTCSFAS